MDARCVLVLAVSALAVGDDAGNHTGKIVAPHVPEVKKQGFMAAIKSNLQKSNEEYQEAAGEGAQGRPGGAAAIGGVHGDRGAAGASAGGARRLGPPRLPPGPREQMLESTWREEPPSSGDMESLRDMQRPGNMERSRDLQRPGNMERSRDLQLSEDMERSRDVQRLGDMERSRDMQRPGDLQRSGDMQRPGNMERSRDMQRQEDMERPRDMQRPADMERSRDMKRPRDMERSRDMEHPRDTERPRDIERPREMERPGDMEAESRHLIGGRMKNAMPGGRKENITPGQEMDVRPLGPEWANALREDGLVAPGDAALTPLDKGAPGQGAGAPGERDNSGARGPDYGGAGDPQRERVAAPGGRHPPHYRTPPRAPAAGAWDDADSHEPERPPGRLPGPPRPLAGLPPQAAMRGRDDRNKVDKLRSFLRNNKDVLKKFILQKRKQKQVASAPSTAAGGVTPMTFTPEVTSHTPMTFTPDRDRPGGVPGQQMAPPWLRSAAGVGAPGGPRAAPGGPHAAPGGPHAAPGGPHAALLDGRGLHALDLQPARGSRIDELRQRGRLCQRSVLMPEGPKYDSKGAVYLLAYNRSRYGGRDYSRTKSPRLLLPVCCNCCKKSVLGCE